MKDVDRNGTDERTPQFEVRLAEPGGAWYTSKKARVSFHECVTPC
jgi:hypothetical protein